MDTMNNIAQMMQDKDIPVAQKYMVLEDHFRSLIIDELEEVAKTRKEESYMKEYILGIRDAQYSIRLVQLGLDKL
jgi:hypothetical protein